MAWAKSATDTLTSVADTVSSGVFTSKTYLYIPWFTTASSTINNKLRVGNTTVDSGSNYTLRHSQNGGADATTTSDTDIQCASSSAATSRFGSISIINFAAEEKLIISESIEANTAGAGNAPNRQEMVGKWVNTSNQIDIVSIINSQAGSFDTDTNLSVLGTD